MIIKNTNTDWLEVDLNILGEFNDTIPIFIKKEGNKLFVSDDSLILRSLSLNNKKIDLNSILNDVKKEFETNGFDKYVNSISFESEELILICDYSKLENDNVVYRFLGFFLLEIKKILDCLMV
jgi:nitrogen fixation/metabolism regulation signal transduction histidine kinase